MSERNDFRFTREQRAAAKAEGKVLVKIVIDGRAVGDNAASYSRAMTLAEAEEVATAPVRLRTIQGGRPMIAATLLEAVGACAGFAAAIVILGVLLTTPLPIKHDPRGGGEQEDEAP